MHLDFSSESGTALKTKQNKQNRWAHIDVTACPCSDTLSVWFRPLCAASKAFPPCDLQCSQSSHHCSSKMAPRKCFYGCEGKVRLFSFPKEASTRQKWEELLFSGQKQRRTYVFVCQRHFTRDCFLNVGAYDAGLSVRLLLKDEALPTILARVEESAEQSASNNISLCLCISDVTEAV